MQCNREGHYLILQELRSANRASQISVESVDSAQESQHSRRSSNGDTESSSIVDFRLQPLQDDVDQPDVFNIADTLKVGRRATSVDFRLLAQRFVSSERIVVHLKRKLAPLLCTMSGLYGSDPGMRRDIVKATTN